MVRVQCSVVLVLALVVCLCVFAEAAKPPGQKSSGKKKVSVSENREKLASLSPHDLFSRGIDECAKKHHTQVGPTPMLGLTPAVPRNF